MNLRFDNLLLLCPTDVRERMEGLKNVQQRPDHHPEGNVFVHTRIVVNRLAKYHNIVLSWAGMFHDIGKDKTTKMGPNGFLQAIGHEDVSATDIDKPFGIASSFVEMCDKNPDLLGEGSLLPRTHEDWNYIREICQYHMRIKLFGEMKPSKQFEMRCLPTFGRLQVFTIADDMHTLTDEELNEERDRRAKRVSRVDDDAHRASKN